MANSSRHSLLHKRASKALKGFLMAASYTAQSRERLDPPKIKDVTFGA